MSRSALARLGLLACIWGASFLFIKVSLEGMSPLQVVVGRLGSGTIVLLAICVLRGQGLPRGTALWGHLLLMGIVANVVPFFLFAWAEQRISSGLAGLLNGSTPLFTMAIALAALPEERGSPGRLAGLLLGFVGVVIVVAPWRATPPDPVAGTDGSALAGQLACLAAAALYGAAFVYTRRFLSNRGLAPLVLSAGQLAAATAVMLVLAPLYVRAPMTLTVPVVASIAVLGAIGTGLAYLLYYGLIRDAGATAASTVTYLVPVVAVTLGILVLGEPLSWTVFVGGAVVVLGVAQAEGRLDRVSPLPARPRVRAGP